MSLVSDCTQWYSVHVLLCVQYCFTFRLSGNSVLPAYPGFMVTKTAQDCLREISIPSNMNLVAYRKLTGQSSLCLSQQEWLTLSCWAICIVVICWATTDNTSISIRLNSSKQAQAPALRIQYIHKHVHVHDVHTLHTLYLARPLKNFPIAMKSSWSEQLNTTHWMAIALARSF